jgi:peroxiredoxin
MKRSFFIYIPILLTFVIFAFAYAGESIEYVTFTGIDGKVVDAEELKGRPLVISIMANWCSACRSDAQEIQKAYLSYRERGVRFLGVFIRSSDSGIRSFAESLHLTYPVGKDTGIARQLRAVSVPVTAFITKEGEIAKTYYGPVSYSRIVLGIEQILQ